MATSEKEFFATAKEVDLWIARTPNKVLVESVGITNLTPDELSALIDYLRDWLGKKVNEQKNIGSS